METIHWDDIPSGSVFKLKRFPDGPNLGLWGIVARLSDDRRVWVSLGDPAEEVVALDQLSVHNILANLQNSSTMMVNVKERGEWIDEPARLPDQINLPIMSWEDVAPDTCLQEHKFSNEVWGIVAVLPEGEHLVLFTMLDEEASIRNFYQDQESAQEAITLLQSLDGLKPSGDEVSTADAAEAASQEDPSAEISVEMILADIEEIEYIEMGWLSRLFQGKRVACLCVSCRFDYVRQLDRIVAKYDRDYGFVPSLFLNMVEEVEANWKARENPVRPAP